VAVYRRSTRPRFTLLLLVLTAITLLTLDERGDASGVIEKVRTTAQDAFAPVQSAADRALRPVGDFFAGVLHYGDLKAENAHLRDQLQRREGDSLRAAVAERENQALKDQQRIDFVGDIPTVSASVVSATASNFDLTVELDKGTDAGVAKDMPVVASAGLVGRVVQVSRLRSTVLLVTDPRSNVGVRLVSSGEAWVAAGTGPGASLRLDLVDAKANVPKGEVVMTSGLQGGRYPPGIPVGTIVSTSTPAGAAQQDVLVRPVVDLRRLQFVKVLQWAPK
jgi:rod shape-determining protein MreC